MSSGKPLTDLDRFLIKLIELTQDDRLIWTFHSQNDVPFVKHAEDAVFMVKFQDKTLALAKRKYVGRRSTKPINIQRNMNLMNSLNLHLW